MSKHLNLKLTTKLLLAFILFTLFTSIVQVASTYFMNEKAAIRDTKDNLASINTLKKKNIEEYFKMKRENLSVLLANPLTESAFTDFLRTYYATYNPQTLTFNAKSDDYIRNYNKYINYLTKYINSYNFDDLYLLSVNEGAVLFSVNKKTELGNSLSALTYKNSSLVTIWKTVSKSRDIEIQDYSAYSSDLAKPYILIGSPVFRGDDMIGVIILQLSEKDVDNIVRDRSGLGSTGESFIAGLNAERIPELRSSMILQKGQIGDQINGRHIDAVLKKGEAGSDIITQKDGIDYITSYERLNIKGLRWGIISNVQKDEVLAQVTDLISYSSLMAIVLLLVVFIVGYNIANQITHPILQIKENLLMLSLGKLPKGTIEVKTSNEIGEIQSAFNAVVDGMKGYVDFADKIGKKQLDTTFERLSEHDVLGTSLLVMQKNLKDADEAARKRQKEEEKQRWMTEGIAKFGDILRQNFETLEKHAENIIINLTNFLKVNQGGLFIYNDENTNKPTINLLACFAFERVKYIDKSIEPGEGLIGSCFTEKETIYLTNIPEDFPNIVSGLGGAKPKSVLIVPLKVDEKVLGIIELISFNEMEKHEIEFVEKIAENIGSSILSSQINDKTAKLLAESKLQSQQMAAQEEEMRQNMEELQATQEESMRKEAENNSVIHALNNCVLVAYLSLEGKITETNDKFVQLLGKQYHELMGVHYGKFNSYASDTHFFDEIVETGGATLISAINTPNGDVLLSEHYTVIYNTYEEPIKILLIAYEAPNT